MVCHSIRRHYIDSTIVLADQLTLLGPSPIKSSLCMAYTLANSDCFGHYTIICWSNDRRIAVQTSYTTKCSSGSCHKIKPCSPTSIGGLGTSTVMTTQGRFHAALHISVINLRQVKMLLHNLCMPSHIAAAKTSSGMAIYV